jgi:hypothetical protein
MALNAVFVTFGSDLDAFKYALGDVTFHRRESYRGSESLWGRYWWDGSVTIYDPAFSSPDLADTPVSETDKGALFTMVHEIGHAFDYSETYRKGVKSWFVPNKSFSFMGLRGDCIVLRGICLTSEGIVGNPASDYAETNSAEDFAETFAVHVANQNGWPLQAGLLEYGQPDQQRLGIMQNLIALTVQNAPQAE